MNETFDPITFELFKNAIFSIADEMALTIFRTTYSGVLKDNMDYSTALADADGKLVAQGLTLPGHLGSVPANSCGAPTCPTSSASARIGNASTTCGATARSSRPAKWMRCSAARWRKCSDCKLSEKDVGDAVWHIPLARHSRSRAKRGYRESSNPWR